jgi:hypothetical protein
MSILPVIEALSDYRSFRLVGHPEAMHLLEYSPTRESARIR